MIGSDRLGTLLATVLLGALALLSAGCAIYEPSPAASSSPPAGAIDDARVDAIYNFRTWFSPDALTTDTVKIGRLADIPVNAARGKIVGVEAEDSLRSLLAKIWLIEQAQYTIDVAYYIFKRDTVGYAILGALCDAVQRGVDVRVVVDSIGSLHATHSELKALETCADQAGYMIAADGRPTLRRARVQVVIFNAVTKYGSWINRRSHDKLLVVDGHFPDKAMLITGGRNVSLSYYGIRSDGSEDPTAYRDLEILLRPGRDDFGKWTVGDVSSIYFTLLFLHEGNRRIKPMGNHAAYRGERAKAFESLTAVKGFPGVRELWADMPRYLSEDFREARVRLAHELANLTNRSVVSEAEQNFYRNPNSITYIFQAGIDERHSPGDVNFVSPYLFVSRFVDKSGEVLYDGADEARQWLEDHPQDRIIIVTNSVLTSDNFLAQSVIDMDMAPRLLLSPEMREAWLSGVENGELNPAIVQSEEWKRQVSNPRIQIFQTGKLDSDLLVDGGKTYGKLHAKFIVAPEFGFVGTSNFDYRSRLLNNEMGFYFASPGLVKDLNQNLEYLRATSYLWGSPEWLEMRRKLMEGSGIKASTTRKQRMIYNTIRALNLKWLL